MMRRLVDTALPLFCGVGLVPLIPRLVALPNSLQHTLGETVGLVWACLLLLAYAVDLVGIWLRAAHPGWSFTFEWPALVFGGAISTIYASAILSAAGFGGWTAAWWIYGIGAYQLARFAELALARRRAKRVEA